MASETKNLTRELKGLIKQNKALVLERARPVDTKIKEAIKTIEELSAKQKRVDLKKETAGEKKLTVENQTQENANAVNQIAIDEALKTANELLTKKEEALTEKNQPEPPKYPEIKGDFWEPNEVVNIGTEANEELFNEKLNTLYKKLGVDKEDLKPEIKKSVEKIEEPVEIDEDTITPEKIEAIGTKVGNKLLEEREGAELKEELAKYFDNEDKIIKDETEKIDVKIKSAKHRLTNLDEKINPLTKAKDELEKIDSDSATNMAKMEKELSDKLNATRDAYINAYGAFTKEKREKSSGIKKLWRKLVWNTKVKVKEDEIPENIKNLEKEYNRANTEYSNFATKKLIGKKKAELANSGKNQTEQNAELSNYLVNDVAKQVAFAEMQKMADLKMECRSSKERSILKKGLDGYTKPWVKNKLLNRALKLATTTAILTGVFALCAPGTITAAGGLGTFVAIRLTRGVAGSVSAQLASKAYGLIISEKHTARKERRLEELTQTYHENMTEEEHANYRKEYEEILKKEKKEKNNRIIHKAMIALLAGIGASVEAGSVAVAALAPEQVLAGQVPAQFSEDHTHEFIRQPEIPEVTEPEVPEVPEPEIPEVTEVQPEVPEPEVQPEVPEVTEVQPEVTDQHVPGGAGGPQEVPEPEVPEVTEVQPEVPEGEVQPEVPDEHVPVEAGGPQEVPEGEVPGEVQPEVPDEHVPAEAGGPESEVQPEVPDEHVPAEAGGPQEVPEGTEIQHEAPEGGNTEVGTDAGDQNVPETETVSVAGHTYDLPPETIQEVNDCYDASIEKLFPSDKIEVWNNIKDFPGTPAHMLEPGYIVKPELQDLQDAIVTVHEITDLSPDTVVDPNTFIPHEETSAEFLKHSFLEAAEQGPDKLERLKAALGL